MSWNVLHVFGYGESQLITETTNTKVPNATLTDLAPMIAYFHSIEQEGTDISMGTLFAMNIYYSQFVDFIPNDDTTNLPQRFQWSEIDTTTIDDLVTEIEGM